MPIMLVDEPVVAVRPGIIVLGEHLVARGPGALVLTVAGLAMVAVTIAVGRDQASELGVSPATRISTEPGTDEYSLAASGEAHRCMRGIVDHWVKCPAGGNMGNPAIPS